MNKETRALPLSEALLCSACFSILKKKPFYSPKELAALGIDSVSRRDARILANSIESSASGIEDLFEGFLLTLRNKQSRHSKGMYFTPEFLVRDMIRSAFECNPQRVVDCGCGAGRFALRACDFAASRDDDVEIEAYDIDPLACLLLLTAAKVQKKKIVVNRADFIVDDIPQKNKKTVYVGNPPYVRHQDMLAEQKEEGRRIASRLGFGSWSKLSGLHTLFIVKCIEMCKPGDEVVFVTGSEWLEVNYGKTLRDIFASSVGGGFSLVQFSPYGEVFRGVASTALVSHWKPSTNVKEVRLRYVPIAGSEREGEFCTDNEERRIQTGLLKSREKWNVRRALEGDESYCPKGWIRLGDLFDVKRGIATGNNSFFVIDKNEANEKKILDYCCPVIAKASDIPHEGGVVTAGLLRKVLFLPSECSALSSDSVRGYIALGEAFGVHLGYNASHRKPWWRISFKAAPIVATYMSRGRLRFALNEKGFPNLNTVHGLYPKMPMSRADMELVVRYLNCGELRGDEGRTYQGGLVKYEPKEMEKIILPSLSDLRRLYADEKLPLASSLV